MPRWTIVVIAARAVPSTPMVLPQLPRSIRRVHQSAHSPALPDRSLPPSIFSPRPSTQKPRTFGLASTRSIRSPRRTRLALLSTDEVHRARVEALSLSLTITVVQPHPPRPRGAPRLLPLVAVRSLDSSLSHLITRRYPFNPHLILPHLHARQFAPAEGPSRSLPFRQRGSRLSRSTFHPCPTTLQPRATGPRSFVGGRALLPSPRSGMPRRAIALLRPALHPLPLRQ